MSARPTGRHGWAHQTPWLTARVPHVRPEPDHVSLVGQQTDQFSCDWYYDEMMPGSAAHAEAPTRWTPAARHWSRPRDPD